MSVVAWVLKHGFVAAFIATAGHASASTRCFSQYDPSLPTVEKVDPFLTNGEAGRQVYEAVASGDVTAVKSSLSENLALLSTRTELPDGTRPGNGNTSDLLTAAVARCDPALVQTLLEFGADANGAIAGLALTYAVLANDDTLAEILLEAGALPDADAAGFRTPIEEALLFEHYDGVALLVSYGADVNRADEFGGLLLGMALRIAPRNNDWTGVKILMDAGANPWHVGNKGVLPAFRLFMQDPRGRTAKRMHQDLLARTEATAPIWPPPNSAEVSRNFLDGTWPTPAMERPALSPVKAQCDPCVLSSTDLCYFARSAIGVSGDMANQRGTSKKVVAAALNSSACVIGALP